MRCSPRARASLGCPTGPPAPAYGFLNGRAVGTLRTGRLGHRLRTSLKVTFPNGVKREMDAVGIRLTTTGGECKIIEVKGQSDSQHALKRYVHRFNETVRLADTHRSVIEKTVGCSEAIRSVSGLFISMAKDFQVSDHSKQPGIDFWNFGRFVVELRKAGFDDRQINLLQESLVVWENDFRDI